MMILVNLIWFLSVLWLY